MSSIIKISNVYEQKIRGNTPKAQQHLYSTPTPMIWIIIHLSCLRERKREREREMFDMVQNFSMKLQGYQFIR